MIPRLCLGISTPPVVYPRFYPRIGAQFDDQFGLTTPSAVSDKDRASVQAREQAGKAIRNGARWVGATMMPRLCSIAVTRRDLRSSKRTSSVASFTLQLAMGEDVRQNMRRLRQESALSRPVQDAFVQRGQLHGLRDELHLINAALEEETVKLARSVWRLRLRMLRRRSRTILIVGSY